MALTCVTITGADDKTPVPRMHGLSHTYPFVEWGILIGSGVSCSRFPSRSWIKDLVWARKQPGALMKLSLHL